MRCCTKDTMFETLMRILNRNTDDVNDDLPDEDSLETARFFDAGTNDKVGESRDGKDVEEEDTFAEADQIFQFFVADEEAAVDSDEGTASASFTGKVSCIPADQCRYLVSVIFSYILLFFATRLMVGSCRLICSLTSCNINKYSQKPSVLNVL